MKTYPEFLSLLLPYDFVDNPAKQYNVQNLLQFYSSSTPNQKVMRYYIPLLQIHFLF